MEDMSTTIRGSSLLYYIARHLPNDSIKTSIPPLHVTTLVYLCTAVILFIWWHRNSKGSNIPRVNALEILRKSKSTTDAKMHIHLTDLGRRFNGLFRYFNFILVDDKDLAHELYIKQDPVFAGRPDSRDPITHKLAFNSQDIAFRTYDDKLKFLRKATFKALHMYGTGRQQFELIVSEELNDLCTQLEATQQQDTNPASLLYGAVANILTSLLFGEKFSYDSEEVQILSQLERQFGATVQLDSDAPELLFNPFANILLKLPISRYAKKQKQMKELLKTRDKTFVRIVQRYKDTFDANNPRGALGQLMLAQIEHGPNVFTDDMLMAVLVDLVIAGTITTFSTIQGLVFSLASDQVRQELARAQIATVVGDSRAVCCDDKEQLPYVSAMILEQLRFQSIASFGVFRTAMCDAKLGDYDVKKGDIITVNQWALHHNPRYWEKPNEFYPEHFLSSDNCLLPTDEYKERGFVPFGAGRRACLGESLAKSRLFLMTATLIQRFHILPPENSTLPENNSDLFELIGPSRPPAYEVRFVPRN